MEKKVNFNGKIYVVKKENDEVTIMRDENGILINLEKEELDDFLTFIGGTYVVDTTTLKDKTRAEIDEKIKSGEIKTIDEITDKLETSSISQNDKEELINGFKVTLDNQIQSDITAEEIDEYKNKITGKLKEYRKPNEFLLSEFSMINGIMHHRLVMKTVDEYGNITEEDVAKKTFDYNQRLIDHLIDPTIQEFASSAMPIKNEYEVKTNITGDTADYTYVGNNNTSVVLNDISRATADRLQKLVEQTEVENKTYFGSAQEVSQEEQVTETQEETNEIYEVDENGERVIDKPWVRVRKDKSKDKHGFINWKFWLLILAIIITIMFFVTKYIILK